MRRSFSTTLTTSFNREMSTTEAIAVLVLTMAPGSTLRLPTKPSTGEVTDVCCRLMRSSWRRASF